MPNVSIAHSDFTEGVYSEFLQGRINLEGYYSSTVIQDNFLTEPTGVLRKRKGTSYIANSHSQNESSRLIPFQFNKGDGIIIEFSQDGEVRFLKNNAVLTVELTGSCPYKKNEIHEFQYVQIKDIVFLVHPNHAPLKLTRSSDNSWMIGSISFHNTNLFGTTGHYPSCVTMHEQRLVFAGTDENPDTIYFSEAGDLYDFTLVTSNQKASDPFQIKIYSSQLNAVRTLTSDTVLYAGTTGGIYRIKSSSNSAALSYDDHDVKKQTSFGTGIQQSVSAGDTIFFLQRYAQKLRAINIDLESDKYISQNVSIKAEHLTRDAYIVQMAVATEPNTMIICVLNTGDAIVYHYEPSEKVAGWSKITTNGSFESVAVINNEAQEEVWFVVKRTLGSATHRYIEKLVQNDKESDLDTFYVDSGVTYNGTQTSLPITLKTTSGNNVPVVSSSGSPFTSSHVGDKIKHLNGTGLAEIKKVISSKKIEIDITNTFSSKHLIAGNWAILKNKIAGLSHLEGLSVNILGDSARFPAQTVKNGAVLITSHANIINAGLAYNADIQLPRPEGGSAIGSAQAKFKRINKITTRLYKSSGLRVGISDRENIPTDSQLAEQIFRSTSDGMGRAPELFTGDKEVTYKGTYDKDSRIFFRNNYPTPCYLIAVFLDMITND